MTLLHRFAPLLLALLTGAIPGRTATPTAPNAPWRGDRDSVLLLHLDGDTADTSGCGNHGQAIGEIRWGEGKFGKALALDGKSGVEIQPSESLTIADQSWTVEAWIKPSNPQPTHAPFLSSGFSHSIGYGFRISYNKNLYAMFDAGPSHPGNGGTDDVSSTLFDGNWHFVATVLDRDRGGEVRVYLDGNEVTSSRTAQPLPILVKSQSTGLALGLGSPWQKIDGFVGLIDEIRISRGVRDPWRSKEPSTPRPAVATAKLVADAKPPTVTLQPKATFIVRPVASPEVEVKAATLLQQWLRKACRVDEGFEIREEGKEIPADAFVLAVGPGNWVPRASLEPLEGRDFLLLRRGNRVVMTGSDPVGTMRAVVRFLDQFCGVRFHMPTDLFTSLPKAGEISLGAINVVDQPRVRDVRMGMFWNLPEENDWMLRNGVGIQPAYITSHTMALRFPPQRFGQRYPEIYPILKGERHIPKDQREQEWQPCFSEPKLVDAAEEDAVEYFRRNPLIRGITYAVQDSHAFCECPRCQEIVDKTGDKTQAYSNMFWGFLNQMAVRLEKRLPEYGIAPNKVLVGMAYSEVRMPPPFKLHPNVMAYPVFTVADLLIDKVLEPDSPYGVARWCKVASQMGQYDWAQGDGYFIPRLYAGLATRLFDANHRFTLATAETYPNWGLDGPKYSMLARIWDQPGSDARKLYAQFCADMFGPAKEEMLAYFLGLEELWISMDGDAERKLFKWINQFTLRPPQQEMVRAARTRLDKAKGLAATPDEKRRIELFSKTFKLSEMMFDLANAAKPTKAQVEKLKKYAADVIVPDPMAVNTKGQGTPGVNYVLSQVDQVILILTRGKTLE
jgi:hypothetical protein